MISLRLLPVVLWTSIAAAQILSVQHGGTGNTSLPPNGPLVGNGTAPITAINPGTAGQCLISGGPGAPPVFAPCPGGVGGGPGAGSCSVNQYVNALINGSPPTCSQITYSQLGGTVPTWNQSTSGNAATATALFTSGTANQVWGMNAGGTAQGWQTPSGGGAGGGGPTFPVQTLSSTSVNATAQDFADCKVFVSTGGSNTLVVPNPAPASGCIQIINYSGSGLTINANGRTINGNAGNPQIAGLAVAVHNPGSALIYTDGTNYFMQKSVVGFGQLAGGTSAAAFTIGQNSSLNTTSNGVINANQINGAAVPADATSLTTNSTGQLVAGGNVFAPAFPLTVQPAPTSMLLSGPGCSGNQCTLTTPATDGTYTYSFELVMTAVGAGCTTNANPIFIYFSFRHADTNVQVNDGLVRTRIWSSNTVADASGAVQSATLGIQPTWQPVHVFQFRAKGGFAITTRVGQVGAVTCDTYPSYVYRPLLIRVAD